ncbi:MAG: GH116 family glycosyl hydrolase [Thermomicrobiales bacterium]
MSGRRISSDPDFQIGAGCLIDQLVGQYMAHICGLGYLADREKIATALANDYRYNFKPSLRGHFNHLRTFALQNEAAMLMASYPHGERPKRPFPYFNEVMTGFEYTAAVGMLYEGQTDAGLTVIAAIRERYDGERRSPFNEAECGHHYARAMASWAAILALTGFHYSAVTGAMTFDAAVRGERTFWSSGDAWGVLDLTADEAVIELHGGAASIRTLTVGGEGIPFALLEHAAIA